MLDPGYEPRPTTAATAISVPVGKICRFGRVSLRAVSYNRNRSTPKLGPVFVTTIAPRMRVFHRQEIKIFFPVGTLFFKGSVTKTSFYPMRLALGIHACHLHVVPVLVARD